jgi:hypothetical protein
MGHNRIDPCALASGEKSGGEAAPRATEGVRTRPSRYDFLMDRDVVEIAKTVLQPLHRGVERFATFFSRLRGKTSAKNSAA